MTTVPFEVFKEITDQNSIKESDENSKPKFDWDEFTNAVSHAGAFAYLESVDVHSVGEGSARVAFILPCGSYKEDPSAPVCLKMSKNEKGYAQTKEEIKLFLEHDYLNCFPKLFKYDQRGRYILTEIGTVFNDKFEPSAKDWFSIWNKYMLSKGYVADGISKYRGPVLSTNLLNGMSNYLFFDKLILMMSKTKGNLTPEKWNELENSPEIRSFISKNKKYEPLMDMFRLFISENNSEIILEDFRRPENWAMVRRSDDNVAIPIDWGFTRTVRMNFYL